MQFANILFNDFFLFLFIFRFYCLPVCLLLSQFFVFQRNPFRVTLRCSIVSGHNGVGGGGPHFVKNRILNSFRNLNIVGCLPLRKLYLRPSVIVYQGES